MQERIQAIFADSQRVIAQTLDLLATEIAQAAELIVQTYQNDGGVLIFGNGGSASDSLHIACELAGRFRFDRPALRAIALVSDAATMTSVANDYGYNAIFARQVEANGRAGDVAIGLSTSGNSPNVVAGLEQARQMGMKTIGFTGEGGGRCKELADVLLAVPSKDTPRVQEAHAVVYHTLCELVEKTLFEGK